MEIFLSTIQAAELLGVSRITVFKKIKSGEIPAKKVGKNYIIKREDLMIPGDKSISEKQKKFIGESVGRVIEDYGETLKLLKDA
ncbi:MAG: excisionase family DNA-binding protein [Candidatus Peregrinibacteria bacterium]|nr:excisionase family DNA-binding protein [Candidatus Peregrinibacteria bacterium]